MSEIIRLIIMIGEIIGFIIFSIIFVMKCDKKRRGYDDYTEKKQKKAKKVNIIYFIVNNIIIISAFFILCPQLLFLSYHKIIYLSLIIVAFIVISLGYYMLGAVISGHHVDITKENIACFITGLGASIIIILIVFYCNGPLGDEYRIQFKDCIDQKETIETIYPEFIGETKIGHFESSDRYIFGFKDNKGTWSIKDDIQVKPENLRSSDNTYIEKHTITRTLKDIERYVESNDYIKTENEVTYVLFLNKEQLIEIKTTD